MQENTNLNNQDIFNREDGREILSPTLLAIKEENRKLLPDMPSACQVCLLAMWFTEKAKTAIELKVFCPKMNSIIYETGKPVTIPLCDGMIQAEQAMLEQQDEGIGGLFKALNQAAGERLEEIRRTEQIQTPEEASFIPEISEEPTFEGDTVIFPDEDIVIP